MNINITSCIVCDLVRAEAGGKLMCLGIYPGGIVAVPSFGIPLMLSFYAECVSDTSGALETWYQFKDITTNTQIGYGQLRLQTQVSMTSPVFTNPLPLNAPRPSTVQLEWAINGNWVAVKTLHLITAAN
jgi:hypothetical protein